MKTKNYSLFVLFVVISLFSCSLLYSALPTYFTYTQNEIAPLFKEQSKLKMNEKELKYWDQVADDLTKQYNKKEYGLRVYPNLYVAQQDAAALSQRIKGDFEGSLNPVSYAVLKLFFPDFQDQFTSDPYSDLLARIVVAKIRDRLIEDERQTRQYPQKEGEEYWVGKQPFYGQSLGSWKTWVLRSSDEFRVPPPPPYNSAEWKQQLKQVRQASIAIDDSQKKKILFWAGMAPGDMFKKSEWLDMANGYMWNHQVPLDKALLVRSTLAMALADASFAVYDSKYTYWVKRPRMRDERIEPAIDTPNHPSYPAGHSTISFTAATVLSEFFPQAKDLWFSLAQEAGISRIWAGIHYPMDNEIGAQLGQNVGRKAVETMKTSQSQVSSQMLKERNEVKQRID